jgi:hypothetical protein
LVLRRRATAGRGRAFGGLLLPSSLRFAHEPSS